MGQARPWRSRVWAHGPILYWYGWKTLRPFWFDHDEYHWRTLVVGWNFTGQVIIALRPFRDCDPGECVGLEGYPGWPIHVYDYQYPDWRTW